MSNLESVEHFGGRATTPATLDRPDVDSGAGLPQPASPASPSAVHPLPRMRVLRDITDRAVFEEVLSRGRVTRAELSTATGISKPTISDAVRRMGERGILVETGFRTGRRGRVATYYELARDSGWVLAIELDADGINVSAAGLCGTVFGDGHRPLPADRARLVHAVNAAVRRQQKAANDRGPLRVVAVSVANPVDPTRSDVLSVPSWPSPDNRLSVRSIFGDLGATQVLVDNDVNLAAQAEREIGVARNASSFGYFYVGTGLGYAFHHGDQLIRGARGLTGEIGRLPTGPGRDVTALQALIRLGFGRPDGTTLDVACIHEALDRARAGDPTADRQVDALCEVLVMAVAAINAVNDPELFVIGGPLGRHSLLFERLRSSVARHHPFAAPMAASSLDGPVALRGAMLRALADGREMLMRRVA